MQNNHNEVQYLPTSRSVLREAMALRNEFHMRSDYRLISLRNQPQLIQIIKLVQLRIFIRTRSCRDGSRSFRKLFYAKYRINSPLRKADQLSLAMGDMLCK